MYCSWTCKNGISTVEKGRSVHQKKLNIELVHVPVTFLLGLCPKELQLGTSTDTYIPVFQGVGAAQVSIRDE